MKPGGEYFLGLLLIIAGAVLILRHYFHFNIPVARTILALSLICLGVSILWGGFKIGEANMIVFNQGKLAIDDRYQEFSLIFANGEVDLPAEITSQVSERKKVNVIFSHGELRIKSDLPVLINADSAFASSRFPDGAKVNFGSYTYRSKGYKEGENYLFIEVRVVFGDFRVIQD